MRILVTGLAGFTGYYIKQVLEARADTVIGLKSDLTNISLLADEIKLVNPDAVIHLAGISFIAHNTAVDFYTVNLLGTYNLLHCLSIYAPNIKSILLASSANIYGNSTEGVLTEITPPNPANDYAISKWAMEKMALLWLNRLPLFIVRPFNYTGIRQNEQFLLPKIVAHFVRKQKTIELGNLDITREFNDVRTIAEIYADLLNRAPIGETINICTGEGHSIREIISLCEEIVGYSIQVKTSQNLIRSSEIQSLIGDPTKLKSFIGNISPKTITDTLQWMLNHPQT